jgi:hypothetical protein
MGLRQRHANLIVGLRPASGLLTQEIVEPDMPALRLQTDYTYDSFGNRQTATVSGSDVATRISTSGFDAKGQFNSVNTNALSQGESWQHDARFGYDSFGRKIAELRPDGTQTKWSYLFCSGVNSGATSCPGRR